MGKRVAFITPQAVEAILTNRGAQIVGDLPDDAKIVGFGYTAYPYNRFELVFESAEWIGPTREGEAIEHILVTITPLKE